MRLCSGDGPEGDEGDEGLMLSPVLLANSAGEGRGKGAGRCGGEELLAGEGLVERGVSSVEVRGARVDAVGTVGAHEMGGDGDVKAAGEAGRGGRGTAAEEGGGGGVASKRKSTRKLYAALGKSISELWSDEEAGGDEALPERCSPSSVSGRRSTAVGQPTAKTTGSPPPFFFSARVWALQYSVWAQIRDYLPAFLVCLQGGGRAFL